MQSARAQIEAYAIAQVQALTNARAQAEAQVYAQARSVAQARAEVEALSREAHLRMELPGELPIHPLGLGPPSAAHGPRRLRTTSPRMDDMERTVAVTTCTSRPRTPC